MLDVDGTMYDVLIKDVEFNPLAGKVDEIDFQALVSNEKVHSTAEVILLNHEKEQMEGSCSWRWKRSPIRHCPQPW